MLTLNLLTWRAFWHSAPLNCQPKTLDLLLCLARHPSTVVSRPEILAAVWPLVYVEDQQIDQQIHHLRRALSAAGAPAWNLIITSPKRGYMLNLDPMAIVWIQRPSAGGHPWP